jgi:hypothetical protein
VFTQESDGTQETCGSCEIKAMNYFSEVSVPGFHMLCIGKISNSLVSFKIWKNGMKEDVVEFNDLSFNNDWNKLRKWVGETLDLNSIEKNPPSKYG